MSWLDEFYDSGPVLRIKVLNLHLHAFPHLKYAIQWGRVWRRADGARNSVSFRKPYDASGECLNIYDLFRDVILSDLHVLEFASNRFANPLNLALYVVQRAASEERGKFRKWKNERAVPFPAREMRWGQGGKGRAERLTYDQAQKKWTKKGNEGFDPIEIAKFYFEDKNSEELRTHKESPYPILMKPPGPDDDKPRTKTGKYYVSE